VPRIADYAGTGLADVPLAAFVTAGAALCAGAHTTTRQSLWIAGGAMLGLSACLKHDGLVYVAVAGLMLALLHVGPSTMIRAMGAALLVAAPWYLYVAIRHVPDRDFYAATVGNFTLYAHRIPSIARLFALNLLATSEWSVLWILVLALAVRAMLRSAVKGLLMLVPVVLPITFYVVSLSLSAWPDYMLHVRTSLDRLIMVTAPFALWFIVDQAIDIATRRGLASRAAPAVPPYQPTATDS
jgi:hypothetical protein